MTDWPGLATTSHYRTAVAVRDELDGGRYEDARRGLEELIAALSRSDRRALKAHLIVLMTHVIKWNTQPERRSRSWAASIANARAEIAEIRDETPSLGDEVVRSLWSRSFAAARATAAAEMDRPAALATLSWDEVFQEPYEWTDHA